jgi:hypothetical protein
MIPVDLTLCGSTIVAYMEEHLMINNSNLVWLQVVTICSSEKTKESIQNQIQGTTCIR